MINSRQFYKELGNLFYAVAAADNKIRPEEKKTLNDEIQFAWKHYDDTTDRFGSDRAFLIQFEFDTMEDQIESPHNAFDSFVDFFKENQDKIDPSTRRRIFNSARHIAESTRKINKHELEYLVKLKELMKV
ncbi:MAG TPA: hypothetical protein PKC72_07660 [Chitinophagaceae bacterium]|nr:hypothetical protein [Chitinophagaceae bacterium]